MTAIKHIISPETALSIEELKKQLFIALEILNGFTETEAEKNWECEHGKCKCQ
jgi:hypothetical protein